MDVEISASAVGAGASVGDTGTTTTDGTTARARPASISVEIRPRGVDIVWGGRLDAGSLHHLQDLVETLPGSSNVVLTLGDGGDVIEHLDVRWLSVLVGLQRDVHARGGR